MVSQTIIGLVLELKLESGLRDPRFIVQARRRPDKVHAPASTCPLTFVAAGGPSGILPR